MTEKRRKNQLEHFEEFRERVDALMDYHNKTYEDLAKQIGIESFKVFHWLINHRTPTILDIKAIAQYFDVSSDFLLGLEKSSYLSKEVDILIYIEKRKGKANMKDVIYDMIKMLNQKIKDLYD